MVDVDDELLDVPACQDLVAGGDDRPGFLLVQPPELSIRLGAGFLHPSVGANHLGMSALARDRIVLDGPGGLRPPIRVVGDLPHAEAVLLFSQGLSPIRSRWEEARRK